MRSLVLGLLILLSGFWAAGCAGGSASGGSPAAGYLARGELGRARVELARQADDPSQPRERLLYNQQVVHAALLDGLPQAVGRRTEFVYDTLRTQGLNESNRSDSFFVNEEGVRVWKGEPYEQAIALCLISVADMMTGRWGNARAAAIESLSRLEAAGGGVEGEFVFGRLLAGVANQQLGRHHEASEHFDAAVRTDPRVSPLVEELLNGRYDALLVVEFGRAPTRIAIGTDGTEIGFRARTVSDNRGLRVVDAAGTSVWPWVADLNQMSADHRWTGLDASRRGKSTAGTLLTAGGVGVAATSDDLAVQAAGLGAAALGMIAKSNARADTRYNELLPQRVYLAPVQIGSSTPEVMIEGNSLSPLRLTGLRPSDAGASVRLIRLSEGSMGDWISSGSIRYANDRTGALAEPTLPWILGGRCVRTPTRLLMREYAEAGLPPGVTYERLMELYHAEAIEVLGERDLFSAKGHILEGGSTLFTPMGGTLGFLRLYASEHPPYRPQSAELQALLASMNTKPTETENP